MRIYQGIAISERDGGEMRLCRQVLRVERFEKLRFRRSICHRTRRARSTFSRSWKSSLAAGEWVRRSGCRLGLRRHLGGHNAVALLQSFYDFGHNAVADSGFDLDGLRLAAGQNINSALPARPLPSSPPASTPPRWRS